MQKAILHINYSSALSPVVDLPSPKFIPTLTCICNSPRSRPPLFRFRRHRTAPAPPPLPFMMGPRPEQPGPHCNFPIFRGIMVILSFQWRRWTIFSMMPRLFLTAPERLGETIPNIQSPANSQACSRSSRHEAVCFPILPFHPNPRLHPLHFLRLPTTQGKQYLLRWAASPTLVHAPTNSLAFHLDGK